MEGSQMDEMKARELVDEIAPKDLVLVIDAIAARLVLTNPAETGAVEWLEWARLADRVMGEGSKLRRMTGPKNLAEMAKAVSEYALAHYADGGWDVVHECWEPREMEAHLVAAGATTNEEAIDSFRELVAIWADRQADAKVEGGW